MFRKRNKYLLSFSIIISMFILSMVFIYHYSMNIASYKEIKSIYTGLSTKNHEKQVLHFGIISRYPPNIIYAKYQPLMDYLSQNTPYNFELQLSKSYEETVQQLIDKKIDAAFLGSFIYTQFRKKYDLKCILKPLNDDYKPFFHAVLIAPKESSILSISDLRNKKIALPSPLSFSTKWFMSRGLSDGGLKVEDLNSFYNFPHHQNVIYQVLQNHFDAGVVKENIAKEYRNRNIKIIMYSQTFPGSPIVVMKNTPPEITNSLKKALLQINNNREILLPLIKNWDKEYFYGFTEAFDKDYDIINSILNPAEEN